MVEKFISEPIVPIAGTFDPKIMATGAPSMPARFTWRDKEYTVVQMLETWKESGPCKSGSKEAYLRKHFFKIITAGNIEMTIYFQRQSRSKQTAKKRWWLYTASMPD